MRKLFLLAFVLSVLLANAQSNFNAGYSNGYSKGYCYDKGIGSVKPITPTIPIPTIYESITSYNDGYNRGFNDGLSKQKLEIEENRSNSNTRYKTSKPTFVENKDDNPYYNINNAIALAVALRESKAKAMQYLENEEYQAVAQICFTGLRVSSKDDEFMLLLGQAYRFSNDKTNALIWLKKASNYRPEDINLKTLISNLEND